MPWRGAQRDGEYPSLGIQIAAWIEAFCVIPDGVHQGEPLSCGSVGRLRPRAERGRLPRWTGGLTVKGDTVSQTDTKAPTGAATCGWCHGPVYVATPHKCSMPFGYCRDCRHPSQSHHFEGCVAPVETTPPSHETDVCPCPRRGEGV